MEAAAIVDRAFGAFAEDVAAGPPLTLRGGNDVDGYDRPQPFDGERDRPTDAYVEAFAFWGLGYLDARSWRHYLPRLIEYAVRHPDDPRMVTEALVRSLRPPDTYPPRLGSLTREQEAVVTAFLELVAFGELCPSARDEAQQALEEWWHPSPRCRPTLDEIEEARRAPVAYREVGHRGYRLSVPEGLVGSGERDIPEESRRVATWAGYLCADAHTMVAVNVTPLAARSLADAARGGAEIFREPVVPQPTEVPGARDAALLDGWVSWNSPAEPQRFTMLLAASDTEVVTVSIRAWPREDVRREVERIVASIRLVAGGPVTGGA